MLLYQWAADINKRQYLVACSSAIMKLYLRRTGQGSDNNRAKKQSVVKNRNFCICLWQLSCHTIQPYRSATQRMPHADE
jgi:hypothetical protein